MMETAQGRLGLGPVDQVSYVVQDMERALPLYEAIYGPFDVGVAPIPDCEIWGKPASCKLKVAVNHSGPLEIELVQVLEGETPHSEHLERHGEGLHHVRFRVDRVEDTLAKLRAEGFESVFFKRFGPTVAFAYVALPSATAGSVIELLEMPGMPG